MTVPGSIALSFLVFSSKSQAPAGTPRCLWSRWVGVACAPIHALAGAAGAGSVSSRDLGLGSCAGQQGWEGGGSGARGLIQQGLSLPGLSFCTGGMGVKKSL